MKSRLFLPLACVLLSSAPALADVRLPRIFCDHMVLQRDQVIRIHGWAEKDEEVTVTLAGWKATATPNADGFWEAKIKALPAGGPYELQVTGKNTIKFTDVMMGDVWFCSGQSNMEMVMVKANNFDAMKKAADRPKLRMFTVPQKRSEKPQTDVASGEWLVSSPKTISYMSATAYYFGKELVEKLDVPIGLIVSAVGGTRIEPWTPAAGISQIKELEGKDKAVDGDLFNAMIHPFVNVPIRGFIWYQGEGNVGDDFIYCHRMRALVAGWRKLWGSEKLPFYFVQITPLNWGGKPKDIHAHVWEAQAFAHKMIPDSGMITTTDIVGNVGEAHPRNKQEVGRRLSLWALARTYGKDVRYASPSYSKMTIDGDKIRLDFEHAEGGLKTLDGKSPTWFTIAGDDKKFVEAEATIDGSSVIVRSKDVAKPTAVRFGWHQIATPNLANKDGLPASPFRTDKPE